MDEEIKEVRANTYMGKRYWVKTLDNVKTVKMDTYGETRIPASLPTHSKEGRPNSSLIPFLNMLVDNHREYANIR